LIAAATVAAVQIAILIFEKLTVLDAIGPYEVLRSVPGWEVRIVGPQAGPVRADSGALGLVADYSIDEVTEPDMVLVPGGEGNRPLLTDEHVLGWLRDVDQNTRWTTSVCTGSLVLGAAGLLEGKRATSIWSTWSVCANSAPSRPSSGWSKTAS
jgi:putative intracellular protease/amidase